MSQLAQSVQKAVDAIGEGKDVNTETGEVAEMAKAKKTVAKRVRKPEAEKAARAPRVKKERVVKSARSETAGLKAKPKGKSLFVNTDGALAVMHKALQSALSDGGLSETEQFNARRLVARLESRQ